MAKLTITIPDNIKDRVLDALCYSNSYKDEVENVNGEMVPNPVSKVQFAKDLLKTYIKMQVVGYEAQNHQEEVYYAQYEESMENINIED